MFQQVLQTMRDPETERQILSGFVCDRHAFRALESENFSLRHELKVQ